MRRRGLLDPLLVASDGAPGMIRAIEECLPRSVRQRCFAHKMRNLQSKVLEDVWPEFRARAMACYQAPSPALARLLRDDIATTYGKDLPSAVACLDDDFKACIAHLRFPLGHRRAARTTNLLERLFGEARRQCRRRASGVANGRHFRTSFPWRGRLVQRAWRFRRGAPLVSTSSRSQRPRGRTTVKKLQDEIRISAGEAMALRALYEAAQVLIRRSQKWSWLKAWGMQIAPRRGGKKAIVALAWRLAVILHRMGTDGTQFRWRKEVNAAA